MSESDTAKKGLTFERVFSDPDVGPFDQVSWVRRTAEILDSKGNHVFKQEDVEFPESYSQLAVNIVASKYFYGDGAAGNGSPAEGKREYSLKQLVGRVADTIADWGVEDGYFDAENGEVFRDELTWLLLNQHGAFNSPVWFNVGLHNAYGVDGSTTAWRWAPAKNAVVPLADGELYKFPQASACYIQSVDDTLDSIMDLAKSEAMLFKGGSGTGTDLSTLRSTREKLTGGGKPSGPVSFFRLYDTVGGIVKSGGKTRRAARMNTLLCDHPDVLDFAVCKVKEDRKARALIAAGYSAGLTGHPDEAYSSVAFQNTNISMRARDSFMAKAAGDDPDPMYWTKAVTNGRPIELLDARKVLDTIAESAWECGDPGIQFHDTLNSWNTVPNTGELWTSNPCGEYNYINNSACNLASLNLMKFASPETGEFDVGRFAAAVRIFITAQEILVDRANYPTEKIAQNSHDYRPLGLGYANLGALLMSYGLPYDSDAGRAYAGAITALMQANANLMSASLASVQGAFHGFAKNREPMLDVMRRHERAAQEAADSDVVRADAALQRLWGDACACWDQAVAFGEMVGYRNGQVSVIAPTGCAVGDTLALTDRGLLRLKTLGDPAGAQWQAVDFSVRTPDGIQRAEQFYVNGPERVVRMTTAKGYRFSATARHRVRVVDSDGSWVWRRMSDLGPDDVLPLQIGGMIGDPRRVDLPALSRLDPRAKRIVVPERMTPRLAELLGAFMANGSSHAKGLRISVSKPDAELTARTVQLFADLFELDADVADDSSGGDCVAVLATSTPLRDWWEAAGFNKLKPAEDHKGKGYKAHVPDAVLATNDPLVYAAFIRGFIDHDGTVTMGLPEFQNTSRDVIADLKVMCLALGFPTSLSEDRCGLSGNPMWGARLIHGGFGPRWMELIGFTEARKRDAVYFAEHRERNDRIYLPIDVFERVCPMYHPLRPAGLRSTKSTTGTIAKKAAVRVVARSVAQELYRETGDPELGRCLCFLYDKVRNLQESDAPLPTYDLAVPSNVTWTGGGFISHNTIAFYMDCDTTGLEPDLGLVKYKKLAGGGLLKITNQAVPRALRRLGYAPDAVERIVAYVADHDTIEGAPDLREADLPVFDCAISAGLGGRSIAWEGHVRMMAAIQPFISGALSKSVNLPNSATVEDIRNAYILGWRLGLKAMAVYRDGSKGVQPLNTKKDAETEKNEASPVPEPAGLPLPPVPDHVPAAVDADELPTAGGGVGVSDHVPGPAPDSCAPCRVRLPDTRRSLTHKFSVGGHEGYVTAGLYPDGRPGELFVTMSKEGSTVRGLMDVIGTSLSIGLQYGVPLEVFVDKFAHTRFEPSGFTRNPDVPLATSVVDYIVRWLGMEFIEGYRRENSPNWSPDDEAPVESTVATVAPPPATSEATTDRPRPRPAYNKPQLDAPLCDNCGGFTVRAGTCHTCLTCGSATGCG